MKVKNGNIIHIPKTNLAYIESHKLVINDMTCLFFNECQNVYDLAHILRIMIMNIYILSNIKR